MEISIDSLIDKHKDQKAFVVCHGPSLQPFIEKVSTLQKSGDLLRFELNNWFDYFSHSPNYWLIANGELNIQDCINNSGVWQARKYPTQLINNTDMTLLFADSVDLSDMQFVRDNLKPDFLSYDQRHFKNHSCLQIMKNFKAYYKEKGNLDFIDYGNNSVMFQPPRLKSGAGFSGAFPFGPTGEGKCCSRRQDNRQTIQETLQKVSGISEHYSTSDTGALHMISFAILMGTNPIYVAGLDLDYRLGYANPKVPVPRHNNDWQKFDLNLRNDLRIINESAKARGIKIINLNLDSWYNELEKGEFVA
jgi:hypothetical protein